jgi:glycosyl transferase family 25
MIKSIRSFCINLDRRQDRWAEAKKEFEKIEVNPTRVSAVEGRKPEGRMTGSQTSCLHSHKKIWLEVIESGIEVAAVFEDDVVFSSDFHEVLKASISELPSGWDLLHLHSTHAGVKPLGDHTNLILKDLWGAHGYILKRSAAERLLPMVAHADGALSHLFLKSGGRPYGIKEAWTICFQRGSDSDIPETQQLGFWRGFRKNLCR